MTAPSVHDVGMHLIRQRGNPCSEPLFIEAYLLCEVERERAERIAAAAARIAAVAAMFEQLVDAFGGFRDALAGLAPAARQADFILAGPGERA